MPTGAIALTAESADMHHNAVVRFTSANGSGQIDRELSIGWDREAIRGGCQFVWLNFYFVEAKNVLTLKARWMA